MATESSLIHHECDAGGNETWIGYDTCNFTQMDFKKGAALHSRNMWVLTSIDYYGR